MTVPGGAGVAPVIRRATAADGPALGDVWLGAWRATFDFPPAHPDDDVRRWLAEEMLPANEVWVADDGGRVVAFVALSASMVEHLYVAPDRIGRGIGRRLLDLAKARRPDGLTLWCFQANGGARRFYARHGFRELYYGDPRDNQEHQPDVRCGWWPETSPVTATPPEAEPVIVPSADGTSIAAFRSGDPSGPPLLLVHGASADHTTFRVVGPRLGERFDVYAIDRRGRGASSDTFPYAIEREFEDVAAVAVAVAGRRGVAAVDVFGHSYGGRCALGAARLTGAIRRVISYEGAPTPPGERYGDAALAGELADLAAADRNEDLLVAFMTRVVGMTSDELARYRADPVWPRRVAAAPTIARELLVEASDAAGLERLGTVRQPVLQILGGHSVAAFASATRALDARLPHGRIVTIPGAKHAAHHTHPDAVVVAVESFLLGAV